MIPEIETNLNKSKIYQAFREKAAKEGDALEAQTSSIVIEGVSTAYEKSKLIVKYMPEYTLHDGTHLFRVLYNMEKLITEDNIRQLSVPDLMLLILTAFFHDLGMAPYEDELRAWKKDWEGEEPNDKEQMLHQEFDRFVNTFPEKIDEILRLREKNQDAKANLLEDHIISERMLSQLCKPCLDNRAKD